MAQSAGQGFRDSTPPGRDMGYEATRPPRNPLAESAEMRRAKEEMLNARR
jgi:hypothetical protein